MNAYAKRFASALLLSGLAWEDVGVAADMSAIRITQDDDGRNVTAHRGDTLQVTLAENASTGYRWTLDKVTGPVQPLATEPSYASDAIGAGGAVSFTFSAVEQGQGRIALKHWRQWEGNKSVTKRFAVDITIEP